MVRKADIATKILTAGNVAKAIGALFALIVTVGAMIKAHDNKVREQDRQYQAEVERISKQDSMNKVFMANFQELQIKQDTMLMQLGRVQSTTKQMSNRVQALDRSHSTLLKDLGKINLLYDFMQDQQKKNENSTSMTPSGPIPYWTPYNSKSASKK
jgi:hypothetical protein